jgi:uncharacterized protein YciI
MDAAFTPNWRGSWSRNPAGEANPPKCRTGRIQVGFGPFFVPAMLAGLFDELGEKPMRYVLIRKDRPGIAERRAALQPEHARYQAEFLPMIVFGGGLVADGTDTSGELDIRKVIGNLLVFEAPDRAAVEAFHANDPYTREGVFESCLIEAVWQRVPDPDA